MKLLILFILALSSVGCSHIDTKKYVEIDLADKSMSVPPGSNGLKGVLKNSLNDSGWRLAMNEVNIETSGKLGDSVVLKQVNTYNTRYRLMVASTWYDRCMDSSAKVVFDLSVIDNQKGNEVFTMSGKACESDIVQSFNTLLLGN